MPQPPTITIHTDSGPLPLPWACPLDEAVKRLLAESGKDPASVATAVNGQFVPRHARPAHILSEGDTVLCFAPITGG